MNEEKKWTDSERPVGYHHYTDIHIIGTPKRGERKGQKNYQKDNNQQCPKFGEKY